MCPFRFYPKAVGKIIKSCTRPSFAGRAKHRGSGAETRSSKSHIGVHGNEIADEMAKKGARERVDVFQVTEGGIRQKIKKWRRDVRQVEGFGKEKGREPSVQALRKGSRNRGPPGFCLRRVEGAAERGLGGRGSHVHGEEVARLERSR